MDRISNLVPKVLKRKGLSDQATASYAVFLANECISEQFPDFVDIARAEKLSGGVLHISADTPHAVQEIEAIAESVLHHVNRYEGISVNEIRVFRKN